MHHTKKNHSIAITTQTFSVSSTCWRPLMLGDVFYNLPVRPKQVLWWDLKGTTHFVPKYLKRKEFFTFM